MIPGIHGVCVSRRQSKAPDAAAGGVWGNDAKQSRSLRQQTAEAHLPHTYSCRTLAFRSTGWPLSSADADSKRVSLIFPQTPPAAASGALLYRPLTRAKQMSAVMSSLTGSNPIRTLASKSGERGERLIKAGRTC